MSETNRTWYVDCIWILEISKHFFKNLPQKKHQGSRKHKHVTEFTILTFLGTQFIDIN